MIRDHGVGAELPEGPDPGERYAATDGRPGQRQRDSPKNFSRRFAEGGRHLLESRVNLFECGARRNDQEGACHECLSQDDRCQIVRQGRQPEFGKPAAHRCIRTKHHEQQNAGD